MQAVTFDTLRDLVLYYGSRRGWRTQRHIAVACGLDESALSRFLNGEQDIGARRTHALFRAIGVPVDQYDLAYALLGRAQDLARSVRRVRSAREVPAARMHAYAEWLFVETADSERADAGAPAARSEPEMRALSAARPAQRAGMDAALPPGGHEDGGSGTRDVARLARAYGLEPGAEVPAAVVVALFAAEAFSGAEIAAFFQT